MTDTRREEARRLRVDPGLSLSQLRKHFGVGDGTLTEWLRGIEPPEWTRRPNAKDRERAEAVELRQSGWSLKDIAERVGVSKSTVHSWVAHIPLDPNTERAREKRALAEKRIAARWDNARADRDRSQSEAWIAAAAEVGALSRRDLTILGAAIYWCEGEKSKPWARRERVKLINSDPGLLAIFLRYVAANGYGPETLNFRVNIHETADAEAAGDWWAHELQVPRDRFRRPTIKHHKPSTRRANVGDDYHGCLTIEVPKSRQLYWHTEGIVRELFAQSCPLSDAL